jgi:hypothetical protein
MVAAGAYSFFLPPSRPSFVVIFFLPTLCSIIHTAAVPPYHPLTFESLGDSLQKFEGRALRDLADFRLRSMRDFTSNSRTFFKSFEGPSKIWADCPMEASGRTFLIG